MRRDLAKAGEHTIEVAHKGPPFHAVGLIMWSTRTAAGVYSCLSGDRSGGFSGLETLPAEYRPSLRGSERHRCFPATLRTYGGSFDPPRASGPLASILPSRFAVAATLRLVLEVFLIIELLFARGEYEFGSAVRTLQHPILKFRHYRPS